MWWRGLFRYAGFGRLRFAKLSRGFSFPFFLGSRVSVFRLFASAWPEPGFARLAKKKNRAEGVRFMGVGFSSSLLWERLGRVLWVLSIIGFNRRGGCQYILLVFFPAISSFSPSLTFCIA